MTTAGLDELARLRELLRSAARDPVGRIGELAAARVQAAGEGPLGREALEAEARWLLAAAAADGRLGETAAAVRRELRLLRDRCHACAGEDDVEVLFELAEARAGALLEGDAAAAATCAAQIAGRAPQVAAAERLCQEADERWAAQTATDGDQPLLQQIEVLRCTGEMLLAVAAAARDRRMRRRVRRRGRRSLRAADDRELVRRTESVLGRRGVAFVENTSFVLLVVVLVVLLLEALVAFTPGQLRMLHWIDGLACAFFIAEFLFKFGLSPHRGSWFVRNAVTDLLPAIPAVLFLLPGTDVPAGAQDAAGVRLLRFFRVTWVARYVQALRPLLAPLRLVLLMVRGMDGLVRRFAPLLDRNFVFFAGAGEPPVHAVTRRELVFESVARERSLAELLPAGVRREVLDGRLRAVAVRAASMPGSWERLRPESLMARDVPVERACEFLFALGPADVGSHLSPGDLRALDRVVQVVRVPPVRWLPLIRRFVTGPLPATAEERVVQLGRRVAEWLQGWQDRLEFFADLHGIVTGPQILDRVASGMVRASQRPAVRLLLFGGLFLLLDLLFPRSNFLTDFVGLPLVILGSVCLVFLTLGWWLKRIAGEASDSFRLTSEAHFVSLLELTKKRNEAADLAFLARRVFAGDADAGAAGRDLHAHLEATYRGGRGDRPAVGRERRQELDRLALLYLHFLDGALLHESDVKTTEQLLANLSLENLRHGWLGHTRRDRKRLLQLRLDDGTVFRGPFLWFRFITESVAVETAKRIAEYNRRCVPLDRRAALDPESEAGLQQWLARRADPAAGRTLERLPAPELRATFATTQFHALHFLTVDRERDEHVRTNFGDDVLAALQADRRNMIREIFGMRPVHLLPRSARSFNAWRFYWSRLSHGRVLLLPLFALWRTALLFGWCIGRIRQIVREVLVPQLAMQQRVRGEATFAVAMRKIHRMKAPGLLEAIRLRVEVDPGYGGAPEGWTDPGPLPEVPELERDLDFLGLRERERAELRARAEHNRELVAQLHSALAWLEALGDRRATATGRRDGELAVTLAWLTDRDDVRTLLRAEVWRLEVLPALLSGGRPADGAPDPLRPGLLRRALWLLADRFGPHPTATWLRRQGLAPPPAARRRLRAAHGLLPEVRRTIDAWNRLGEGEGPTRVGIERLQRAFAEGAVVRRELLALRAVQSLSVLDVRNYREVVFRLGGFAADGEDPELAGSLP